MYDYGKSKHYMIYDSVLIQVNIIKGLNMAVIYMLTPLTKGAALKLISVANLCHFQFMSREDRKFSMECPGRATIKSSSLSIAPIERGNHNIKSISST